MIFNFKHSQTGEVKTLTLTEEQMANLIDSDILFDEFAKRQCSCEPIGETNVADCNCEDYLCEFELQDS